MLFRRSAAMIPAGTAMTSAIRKESAARLSVLGRPVAIAPETVSPEAIEPPRSPVNTFPNQRTYWTCSGWSSPSLWRRASAASGVYSGPSIWMTGSPGIMRSMKKTRVAQPQMIKRD
jgi:hypothetical protein